MTNLTTDSRESPLSLRTQVPAMQATPTTPTRVQDGKIGEGTIFAYRKDTLPVGAAPGALSGPIGAGTSATTSVPSGAITEIQDGIGSKHKVR